MLWRFLFPLILLFGPMIIPRVIRTVYLVWKLLFDSRVPLLLKLVVPGSLLYFLTPFARLHFIGLIGFAVVLLAAVWVFLNLAPRNVVEDYAPWRSGGKTPGRRPEDSSPGPDGGSADPSRVVEGSYRVVDDEEPTKNKSQ